MNIRPFIRDASFNPEAIQAMSLAYDNAKALIERSDATSCETIAIRIITLASCGELDPDKLTAAAVKSFTEWNRL